MKLRSRDAFPAETSANGAPDEVHHQVLSALQAGRLGISFSGAGFGAAYQLGAAYMLQELGVLQKHTSVTGTSAGSIVAVAICCKIPYLAVLSELKVICNDLLQNGFPLRLRSVLQPALERLLPADAHERCNSRPGFALAATRIQGPCPVCWKAELMQEPFCSRDDLVQRLLTAVHEPVGSDGRLFVKYRRHRYADGGLQMPVPPVPGAAYSIIIYPVPNSLLTRKWPYKLLMHPPLPAAVAISPGQYSPWPLSKSFKKSNNLVMYPQPPQVLDMLFERGRRDALRWAQHIRLPVVHDLQTTLSHDQQAMTAAAGEAGKHHDVQQDEPAVLQHQRQQVHAAVSAGPAMPRGKVVKKDDSRAAGSATAVPTASACSSHLVHGDQRCSSESCCNGDMQADVMSQACHDGGSDAIVKSMLVRRQQLLSQRPATLPTLLNVNDELLHWL